MAKADRDPEYMKEMFGTTSLVTDYGEIPAQTHEPDPTIDSILEELDLILASSDSFLSKPYNVGLLHGQQHLARTIYGKLQTLRNKQ
jgi:hypothetical protein